MGERLVVSRCSVGRCVVNGGDDSEHVDVRKHALVLLDAIEEVTS
jgi:hypothetical protein